MLQPRDPQSVPLPITCPTTYMSAPRAAQRSAHTPYVSHHAPHHHCVLCARLSRALPGPRTVGCGWGEAMSSSSRPLNGMPGSRAEGQVQRSGWAAAFGKFLESPARGGWPGLSCAHGGERPDSGSQARGRRPSPGEGPGGSGVRALESGCSGRALQPVLFPTSLRTRG